jgi:hypothetical protein
MQLVDAFQREQAEELGSRDRGLRNIWKGGVVTYLCDDLQVNDLGIIVFRLHSVLRT